MWRPFHPLLLTLAEEGRFKRIKPQSLIKMATRGKYPYKPPYEEPTKLLISHYHTASQRSTRVALFLPEFSYKVLGFLMRLQRIIYKKLQAYTITAYSIKVKEYKAAAILPLREGIGDQDGCDTALEGGCWKPRIITAVTW